MAGPRENAQVSPSPSPPKALPARHPSGCGCLITPLPAPSALVTSASLPSAATPALVPSSYAPQLQCPLCPPSNLPPGSSVLCPCLSGHPQVLTPESEHLGDQIRHGSSGQCWVTLRWAGGKGWRCLPTMGLRADLASPPRTHFPSLQGPLPHLIYRTPLLPAPLGCREPGKGGKSGLGRGPAVPASPAPSPRLPICCTGPSCSSGQAEAEKEKAGTGAHTDLLLQRPRAVVQTGHPLL